MMWEDFSLNQATKKNDFFKVDSFYVGAYISQNTARFQHIMGVVEEMNELLKETKIDENLKKELITAAYLHDIGYSEQLSYLQYHPLDGAIFCLKEGFSKSVVAAVLFHTASKEDVEKHHHELVKFYDNNATELDEKDCLFIQLVTYCDLHRSSTGKKVSFDERIADILHRYGREHPTSQFILEQTPYFVEIIEKTIQWKRQHQK